MSNQTKQKDRLRKFFKERPNTWIPLPEILKLLIAQYNARIFDLRGEGMKIENKTEIVDGQRHSYYRYVKYESSQVQDTMPFAKRSI